MIAKTTIEPLDLPDVFPTEKAIKSWGQSRTCYEPEYWEFEYRYHRYLSNIDLLALQRRYVDIAKNLACLASPERHVIPLNTFLSSWYWYRKEHQTRLELHLRGHNTPVPAPKPISSVSDKVPRRPSHPNAGDILYRYTSEQRVNDLATLGSIRMWHAEYYAKLEKNPARQDKEMSKNEFLHGPSTVITAPNGQRLPVIGDVQVTHTGPDYYLLCMSCDWDPRLLDDFEVSHCAVISNVDEFSLRLERATSTLVPGWLFYHNPVEYFDPYESPPRQCIDHATAKDFRFSYQREYRFLLMRLDHGPDPQQYLDIAIGNLTDCLEVCSR